MLTVAVTQYHYAKFAATTTSKRSQLDASCA